MPFFRRWKILGEGKQEFYNKCSENSRSQIVFVKLTLGAPEIMSTEGTLSNVERLLTKGSGRYIREIKRRVDRTKNPWLL